MTAQVPDSCTVDGRKWVIEHWDGPTECVPANEQLGIQTVSASTANWSGRIDHFLVHHRRLYLFKVEITLAQDDRHTLPPRVRREVLIRYELMHVYDANGDRVVVREHRFELLLFDDLIIPFTGEVHLAYPYFDAWELPLPINDEDEETTEQRVLYFENGVLQ